MKPCSCGSPAVVELVVTSTWRYRASDRAPKRVKEIVERLAERQQHGVATTFYCESCLQTVGEVAFPSVPV